METIWKHRRSERLGCQRKFLMEMVARDRIELTTSGFSVLHHLHPGTPRIIEINLLSVTGPR